MLSKKAIAVSERNQDNVNPLTSLKVFAFQPEEAFYSSSFEERLKILESRILLAQKDLPKKEANEIKSTKNLSRSGLKIK